MLNPPVGLIFEDQFAFRPTGSATAALIAMIQSVIELLGTGRTVILISLDFSKAFDRVRHASLFTNLDKLNIHEHVYNWLMSYFEDREHRTKFCHDVSPCDKINASVVQGSGVGPACFSVTEASLQTKTKKLVCISLLTTSTSSQP